MSSGVSRLHKARITDKKARGKALVDELGLMNKTDATPYEKRTQK